MKTFQCGFICLMLVLFSKTAHAALGNACANDGQCNAGNNEVCDTGGTGNCVCDSGNGYAAGPVTTATCYLAVNLAGACTSAGVNDECLLGNGGTGTICSATPDCQCDAGNSYVEDASTCKKDCGIPANPTGYTLTAGANAADKLEGATATVACATGYSEDAGTPTGVQCQAGGTWAAPTGCTVVDCGTPATTTGYTVTVGGGTSYSNTATVACATGYSGSPASITCQADGTWVTPTGCAIDAKNLGVACDIAAQCVAGDGGAGTVCDTTCKKDCGSITNPTGYTLTTGGSASATYQGATATVACATGYTGTPTSATVTCQADGTWETPSGCAIDAKDLGIACSIDAQCVAGNGGTGATCDTTCQSGASDIRQKFSFVMLIGVLVLTLM